LAPDLTLASVFQLRDLDHLEALYAGAEEGFIYARDGHPNAKRLADRLAEIEGAEAGLVVGSGMAAVAALFLSLLKPGDRVVSAREIYGKTRALLNDWLGRMGVVSTFIDATDIGAVGAALADRPRILWLESLSNPLCRAARLDRIAPLARQSGTLIAIDATFAPPPIMRPLQLGADIVVHSLTKMLSGHGDVTMGALCGSRELISTIQPVTSTFGMHASAFDCWLTERGLETLELRARMASTNAQQVARWLTEQAGVAAVHYPGLSTHPDAEWLQSVGALSGSMLSFDLPGGRDAANRFLRELKRTPFCPSLGDVRTTVSHPWLTSHRALSEAERRDLGITPGTIRVSVGIEPADETIADFAGALRGLGR
jgi:cystathionine beta-lyase/cystathionine gamma-synthase